MRTLWPTESLANREEKSPRQLPVGFLFEGASFSDIPSPALALASLRLRPRLALPTNAPPVKIEVRDAHAAPSGEFTFNVTGAANSNIEIQTTENLTQWSSVMNVVPTTSPQLITIPADPNKPYRFFRILLK